MRSIVIKDSIAHIFIYVKLERPARIWTAEMKIYIQNRKEITMKKEKSISFMKKNNLQKLKKSQKNNK